MRTKTTKIIMWVLVALMTFQFLAAGLAKFVGAWTIKFVDWGYPAYFVYLVGLVEVGGVVLLFFTKLRKWGVLVLIITMLGAMVTHIMNDEFGRLIHNGILVLLLSVIWFLGNRLTS